MEKQLSLIAASYDKTIDFGKKGINQYQNLPDLITGESAYLKWKAELEHGSEGSGKTAIRDYLSPKAGMNFVDLGCSLNLMFHGYDQWPSQYHGVDISEQTVQLLKEFAAKHELKVGSLYCGGIHETPFEDNCFDIGTCIGVLEYFDTDYVEKALMEAHRIIRPGGRFVLDIPNIISPSGKMMLMIEAHMGRPGQFRMLPREFEDLLNSYFDIEDKDREDSDSMGFLYYLTCKK